jgi:DNA-binding winged helix-turn-helix (wHTH) protein/Tol biopolymer transport system component
MAVTSANELPAIRFGTFEVDLRAGELRRNGSRIRLQEQPFQILLALIERPGEVVTRDELQKKLWPADTFVDFDHSLNAAIRRLRDALGDSAENPRFVETVARRGYRFIAPVNGIATPVEQPKADPAPVSPGRRKWLWLALVPVLAIVLSIGFHAGLRTSQGNQVSETRLTANPEEARVTGAAISADGKWLAFSDKYGCYLRQMDTGETHSIPLPAGFIPKPESWFPDGTHILVTWVAGPHEPTSLWTISIMGGTPRKLADQGRWAVVSPDGSQIVYAEHSEAAWLTPEGSTALWIMQAHGEKPQKILESDGSHFKNSFGPPAWSPDGKRIAFVRSKYDVSGWGTTSQIETLETASGKTEFVLQSPGLLGGLAWTKDDRLIYATIASPLSPGSSSLWAYRMFGPNNPRFRGPVRLTSGPGYIGSISISTGNRLTFLRNTIQPDVYVSTLEAGGRELSSPRRLTLDDRDDYPFAWTPDNKYVLFVSNRDGPYHIFKQAMDQTEPELLVGGDMWAYLPRLTPDGSSLLYYVSRKMSDTPSPVPLMRMPLAGGPPQLVLEHVGVNNEQCARAPATLCLLSEIDQKGERFFSFDPVKGAPREIPQLLIEGVDYSTYNWSLSPNGQSLVTSNKTQVYTSLTKNEPAIKITSLHDFSSRTIPVPGWAALTSLDWAADSKSVWAAAHTTDGAWALLNVDLEGHVRLMLREDKMLMGWAIQSSDGHHLALWKASGNSNVWMLDKF